MMLSQPSGRKYPLKNEPTTSKPHYKQKTYINITKGIAIASSSADEGDCITEYHRFRNKVYTMKTGDQSRASNIQKPARRVS